MKKITIIFLISLFLLTSKSFSQKSGTISIHSAVNPLTMTDLTWSNNPSTPASKIGLRINTSEAFAIEISSGLIYNSGNDMDSISNTSANPGAFIVLTELTGILKILNTEKASLSLFAGVGMSFQEWHESDWSNDETTYESYDVIIPSFFIGLEPEYKFSKNFSMFSKFGIYFTFIPNSKEISYNFNGIETTTRLIEREDSKTVISTDGLSIGLRYYF